jgi:molybdenum cofactor biosynthesis enzyme MoaA
MQCDFQCSYCGEWNASDVDESAGSPQEYVEDCQVCCQPNVLSIRFDAGQVQFVIWAERES